MGSAGVASAGLRPIDCAGLAAWSSSSPEARVAMSTPEVPEPASQPPPWYRDGLAFACTRCGACCTGTPGYVWVGEAEINRLAGHLGVDVEEFGRRFLRSVGSRLSLVERPGGDCIFWDRTEGCTVYPARPTQCRTWPFWPRNLAHPDAWAAVGRGCPGIGRGPIHDLVTIEAASRGAVD